MFLGSPAPRKRAARSTEADIQSIRDRVSGKTLCVIPAQVGMTQFGKKDEGLHMAAPARVRC